MTEKFFTVLEVADFLKVSERTVRNLCYENQIEYNRIGSQIRISETQLNNYLKNSLNEKGEDENE